MTFNSASNRWEFTTNTAATATELDCDFNNGASTWDNNGGSGIDFRFTVLTNNTPQPPSQPQNLALKPVQTNQINLTWSPAAGGTTYLVSRGASPVALTAATSYSDTGLAANSSYCYSVVASNSIGLSPASATLCTNTPLALTAVYPPFVMDGVTDFPGYLVASNTMTLYAALRGTKLYVATWSPGTSGSNDHFILITDQLLPAATTNAPWGKSGKIAMDVSRKPYLAGESLNSYIAWYNAPTGSQAFKTSTSAGQMEGTLDLALAFGSVPTNIYLCAAAYQTADGGALAAQCLPASGADLGSNSFFVIPTAALGDNNADGLFDRLDPGRDFALQSFQCANVSCSINWASMPGHNYQLLWADSLSGTWSNLAGGGATAGPMQLFLTITDAPPQSAAHRFYKIRLMP
jgi:hypothetical protein